MSLTPPDHDQLAVEAREYARKAMLCSFYGVRDVTVCLADAFIAGAAWQKALDRRAESGEGKT